MRVRDRELHFGIQLHAQRTTWPEYVEAIATVEHLGYDSLWTFDHLLPYSGRDDGPCFETIATWAALAVLTKRPRVGVLVNSVLYRDPVTLAKSAAQIDIMSGGRMEFSLGAAWAEREFRTYGLYYPRLTERYSRLDEALDIVRSLWTAERTSFRGKYYELNEAPLEPKPLQKPLPPITVGGSGDGTLRLAAKHADRWNSVGSPERCAAKIGLLEGMCADIGRNVQDIEFSVHPMLALARSSEAADLLAAQIASSHGYELSRVRESWLIGTPTSVVAQVRGFVELGYSHFVLAVGYPYDAEMLRLFRDEVWAALV